MSWVTAKAARTPLGSGGKDDAEERAGILRSDGELVVVCVRTEFCPPGHGARAL